MDARFRGCVMLCNIVLRRIILRAKALAYIDNGMIIQSLHLSICLLDHVAQGFNPAKADCDTTSFSGMTTDGHKARTLGCCNPKLESRN